jgi:hypothetical protein
MWQGASRSLISAMSLRFRDNLKEAQAEVKEEVAVVLSTVIVDLIRVIEVALSIMIVSSIKVTEVVEEVVAVVVALNTMIDSLIKVREVVEVAVVDMSNVIVSSITNDLVRSMTVTSQDMNSISTTEPEMIASSPIIMTATDSLVEVEATIAETTDSLSLIAT